MVLNLVRETMVDEERAKSMGMQWAGEDAVEVREQIQERLDELADAERGPAFEIDFRAKAAEYWAKVDARKEEVS